MSYNPNLSNQMSGPYAQGVVNSFQHEFDTYTAQILSYYENLSIATADVITDSSGNPILNTYNDLESIGLYVGYPWPVAPIGTFNSNNLTLTTYTGSSTSPIGLSAADGSFTGGVLTSSSVASGTLIPSAFYRLMLTAIAYIKYNGLTYNTLDKIITTFCNSPNNPTGQFQYLQRPNTNLNLFTMGTTTAYSGLGSLNGWSSVGQTYGGKMPSYTFSNLNSDILVRYLSPVTSAVIYMLQNIFNFICTSPSVAVSN